MKEILSYTHDELIYLAIMQQLKTGALERVLAGVIGSMPSLISQIDTPVTIESGQAIASDLMRRVPQLFEAEFLALLEADTEIPDALKAQLRDSFGQV